METYARIYRVSRERYGIHYQATRYYHHSQKLYLLTLIQKHLSPAKDFLWIHCEVHFDGPPKVEWGPGSGPIICAICA